MYPPSIRICSIEMKVPGIVTREFDLQCQPVADALGDCLRRWQDRTQIGDTRTVGFQHESQNRSAAFVCLQADEITTRPASFTARQNKDEAQARCWGMGSLMCRKCQLMSKRRTAGQRVLKQEPVSGCQ
jgi:hypothetical protein